MGELLMMGLPDINSKTVQLESTLVYIDMTPHIFLLNFYRYSMFNLFGIFK